MLRISQSAMCRGVIAITSEILRRAQLHANVDSNSGQNIRVRLSCVNCRTSKRAMSRRYFIRRPILPHTARRGHWCSSAPKACTSTTPTASAISKALPVFGARASATATRSWCKRRPTRCASSRSPTSSVDAATSRRSRLPRRSRRYHPRRRRRFFSPVRGVRPTIRRSSCSGITTTRAANRARRRSSAGCAATTA